MAATVGMVGASVVLRYNYGTKMAATVGVVGAPSSGIELVLSKNYLRPKLG
jgi:hypothetical protein